MREKGKLFDKQSWKKSSSIWEKRKVVPYLTPYKNKYLQIDLTVEEKSLKTFNFKFWILDLIENITEYLLDLGVERGFSNITQKMLILEILKQRTSNDTLKKQKRQVTNRLA